MMNINKNLQKISLALFMGFSTCLVTAQVTQVSKIMAQYEDAFFNKIEEISDNYNKKVNYLNAQYMDRLHRDIIAMKSRGALYEVKAAQDEIARFGKDNQLLAKNVN
jgi:outer membrane murein-binding lipoprotein Lpp